jgi:hypothetical protein
MEGQRKVQLDQRRRRLLRDEAQGPAPDPGPCGAGRTGTAKAGRNYTNAARGDGQLRITDLIPRRPWSLAVILLGGLTAVVGLLALHVFQTRWGGWVSRADRASLDLTSSDSVASWFSAVALVVGAGYALVIYSIRRHKVDDYRGRYALWLWAVIACLVASIDATTGLHRIVRGVLVTWTGVPLFGDGSIWWLALAWITCGLVGVRVLLDMRRCAMACVSLVAASLCYAAATWSYLGFMRLIDDAVTIMLQSGLALLGHVLVLFSFLVYGRYVFRDAQGEPARPKDRSQVRQERLRLFATSGQGVAGAENLPNPPATAVRVVGATDSHVASPEDPVHLSKAERRRLRKEARRQRRAA